MRDTLIFIALITGWGILNIWVLPYFGIRTCMNGGCRLPEVKPTEVRSQADKAIRDTKVAEEVDHR